MKDGTPQGTQNILIVDDTPVNLLLLERMLTDRGYRTRPVLSGKLALEAARAEAPDLILLDITMPEMNGYEVCRKLKADAALKDIPVIFISALNETIDKVKAFSVGGVDYVTKPFHLEEVCARVQTHVQLRRLEKLRDDLIHLIVHDMRTPLMCITLGLELHIMQVAAKLTEAEMKPVVDAAASADKLVEMVSSLLDISRMEAGKMPVHLEECDLTSLTREVVELLRNLKQDCQLEVVQQDPVMVRCDRDLMRRVLINIGANAMKFARENGRVKFDIQKNGAGTKVLITDNGPGIPREYHSKVFEKFGQVETRQEGKLYSTGLGLTFCKLAVEAHRGEIGVESEVGRGSTFWFTLPRVYGTAGKGNATVTEQKSVCLEIQPDFAVVNADMPIEGGGLAAPALRSPVFAGGTGN